MLDDNSTWNYLDKWIKERFLYSWQNEEQVEQKVLGSQRYVGLIFYLKQLAEEEVKGIKSNKQPARIANMMF